MFALVGPVQCILFISKIMRMHVKMQFSVFLDNQVHLMADTEVVLYYVHFKNTKLNECKCSFWKTH